jgi:hypothetical protein
MSVSSREAHGLQVVNELAPVTLDAQLDVGAFSELLAALAAADFLHFWPCA